MKKLLMLSFVALMLITPFTLMATGKQEAVTKGGPVVVNVLAYGDNANQEGVSWGRIVKSFEKENPNIDIDYELLYDEAYHQKVVARLASGDIPDMAYMGADARWGAPWQEAGQQYDHRDILDPMYDRTLIPSMGPNGEIYEIPLGTSNITSVLFMNKKLVEELGFSTPKTYEDIVAMVPAAKAKGIDVISLDGADGWAWNSCLLSGFIARTSGDPHWVSKAVSGTHKFTDKAFVDALALVDRMGKDGVLSPKTVLVDYGLNISNFNNEKALFMIQGQWAAGGIENQEVADNTVLLAWPKLPGEKAATQGSVSAAISVGYGITKKGASNVEVRDAAMKFINYFYSEQECTQRLRDGTIIAPLLKNYKVPDDISNIIKSKIDLAQHAMTTEVIDAYLTGAPNEALNEGLQKIFSGQATPEEVAANVENLVRK